MFNFCKTWVERWSGWVGDRDMEQHMRRGLTRDGFPGATARFTRVRLAAIHRPGWVQIYEFEATFGPPSGAALASGQVYGLVRQDERHERVEVRCFTTAADRQLVLRDWSPDICPQRRSRGFG